VTRVCIYLSFKLTKCCSDPKTGRSESPVRKKMSTAGLITFKNKKERHNTFFKCASFVFQMHLMIWMHACAIDHGYVLNKATSALGLINILVSSSTVWTRT
jgi:hypothetical protein